MVFMLEYLACKMVVPDFLRGYFCMDRQTGGVLAVVVEHLHTIGGEIVIVKAIKRFGKPFVLFGAHMSYFANKLVFVFQGIEMLMVLEIA